MRMQREEISHRRGAEPEIHREKETRRNREAHGRKHAKETHGPRSVVVVVVVL